MDLPGRIKKYQAIEEYRERPLLVYATSTRQGVTAMMASDAVREFVDQIDKLTGGEKRVDVLIHSSGGDALTAWKLMSILRERFENVSVLVPFAAFSAATIFSLGANEIVMHPHASLGPIDPQITTQTNDGKSINFSYEDLGAFLRFLKDEAKISEPLQVTTVIEKLFSTIDPIRVGGARRASELSTSVGERLLLTHMRRRNHRTDAKKIAEDLNKSFFAHGDAVSRSRANELGLAIAKPDPKLEALIWDAFLGLEAYMEIRTPFDFMQHFLADQAAAQSLAAAAPLRLPQDIPPQLAQQIFQQIANQAAQAAAANAIEIGFSLVAAVMESPRLASEVRVVGTVSATRQANSQIAMSVINRSSRWASVPMPPTSPDGAAR